MTQEIAVLILAAGRGSRFGAPGDAGKLTADLQGVPLVRHVALAALASTARPVLIVTGHNAPGVRAALEGLDLNFIDNPSYGQGLSVSLKLGLAALPETTRGAVVLLGDMPLISDSLINRLALEFFSAEVEPLAVVPVHLGRRGNPVVLGRGLFQQVSEIDGDKGARVLIDRLRSGVIECDVDDGAIGIDVDTQEILRNLQNSSSKECN